MRSLSLSVFAFFISFQSFAQCPVDLGPDTVSCSGQSVLLDAGSGYTYLWSDSSTAQTMSVNTSGTFWVSIADTSGCTNSDTVNVVFNSSLTIQISGDSVLYWGYDPLECGTLIANISGGTPPYDILWSNGELSTSIVVCDTLSTSYIVSVTDQSGCLATDTFLVNVQDIRCGNSNDKVLMCHVPPGNPNNEHNICISENAVPAHFAHGCYLGICNSLLAIEELEEFEIELYPNPSNGTFYLTIDEPGSLLLRIVSLDGKVLAEDEVMGPIYNIPSKDLFPELNADISSAVILSAIDLDGRRSSRQMILFLR